MLDTNVVLDCLVYADPSCRMLSQRLAQRQCIWVATPAMRAELQHVLPRLTWRGLAVDCERTLTTFDILVDRLETDVQPSGTAPMRRCRDADDQKFLDLAVAVGARWLFSRDRSLLELAKPARALGLEILTPALWSARNASQTLPDSALAG